MVCVMLLCPVLGADYYWKDRCLRAFISDVKITKGKFRGSWIQKSFRKFWKLLIYQKLNRFFKFIHEIFAKIEV